MTFALKTILPKKRLLVRAVFYLLFFTLCFSISPVSADTIVNSNITTNTTWNLTGSPYIITNNITVNQGVTLTIEPGVQVKFDGYYSLTVNGTLNAQGTPTNQIVFTSNRTTPNPGDWGSIYFADSSDDANCIISYAKIEYAYQGIYFYSASPRIQHNTIQNNYYGLWLYGYSASSFPHPALSYNSLISNMYYNLFTDSNTNTSSVSVNAQNNWWGTTDPNTISNTIYDYNDYTNRPVVDFSGFLDGPEGNPVAGNYISGPIATNTTWTVANSPYIVIGNITVNQGVTLTIEPGVQVRFRGYQLIVNGALKAQGNAQNLITFTSDYSTPSPGQWSGIYFSDTSDDTNCILSYTKIEYANEAVYILNASPKIEYSTIQNSYVGLHLQDVSSPNISHNTIINNNSYGIYLYGFDVSNYPNPTIDHNSIYNNPYYNLWLDTNNNTSSLTINAQNNWWGTVDAVAIANKIFDNNDSSNRPVADFTPFLDGPDGNPVPGNFISGPITTNTTWTIANSPYIVIGNITVNQGVTLTIEPGVQVKFAGNFQFTVNGALKAQGNASNLITFTSNLSNPSPGNWQQIYFADTSDDANCILSYTKIEYAGTGVYTYNASPQIDHTTIQNNYTGINLQYQSSSNISHNTIINNNSYGIYMYGPDLTNYPRPVINNNSIYGNSSQDLFTDRSGNVSSITINAQNNWWGTTDAVAINNKIYDNNDDQYRPVVDFTPFLDGPDGNPVPGNFISGPITTNTTWTIANSPYIVIGNITVNQGVTLTIEPGVVVKFAGNFNITVNGSLIASGTQAQNITFTSNKSTPNPGDWQNIYFADASNDSACLLSYVKVEYAYQGIYLYSASPRIEHTTLQNNYYGLWIYGYSVPSYPHPVLRNNSLLNNLYYNLFTDSNYDTSSVTLNARNNWWGTTDTAAISSKIYDYNDYTNRPVVDFSGFLDGPDGNPVPGNFISGPINTNTTWTLANSPYIVIGNITIAQGVTLTIEPGVVVKFDGYYQLLVNGTLNAQGTPSNLIVFTSNRPTPSPGNWNSVYFNDTSNDTASIIAYATIEYANDGIYLYSASPRIENNTIQNNYTGINLRDVSLPTITHNTIINNNSYGIYLYGYDISNFPNPTLTNNSIYNNGYMNLAVASNYNTSALIINAQNNWWGTIDPIAIANKIYDNTDNSYYPVVDFTPFLDGPNGNPVFPIYLNQPVGNFLVPVTQKITFDAKIDEFSNWTIEIKDSSNVTVKTFTASNSKTMFAEWYGYKEDGITVVNDGIYSYKISAVTVASGINAVPVTGYIAVSAQGISASISSPLENAELSGKSVQIIGTAQASTFNRYVLSYTPDINSTWTMITNSYAPVVEGLLYAWDVSKIASGNYVLRLQTFNNNNDSVIDDVNITINNIQITNVSESPRVFNPSNGETIHINYTLDREADVTVTIEDLSYNAVKTIGPNHKLAGVNTDVWDGKNNSGQIVSPDAYTFTIEATNGTNVGEYTPEYIPNAVGVTGFNANLNFNPYNNELCKIDYNLADYAQVLLKAGGTGNEDPNWAIVNWEPRNPGANSDYWNGRDQNNNIVNLTTANLAIWTRALPDEPIIVVSDFTAKVSTDPYSIIPSYGEFTTITYNISKTANVTVSVNYPDATLVKVLENNAAKQAGTYSLTWDGTDSSGKVVSQEGNFTIKVEAISGDGKTKTALGNVTVY